MGLAFILPSRLLAAIESSRRPGTARSVERVLGSEDRPLREAARDAVRAIPSRLGDAGARRLSIVEACAGQSGVSPAPATPSRERTGEGE